MIQLKRAVALLTSAVIMITIHVRASDAQSSLANACALVTPSELASVVGSAVTLKPGSMGEVQTCRGATPTASVSIRLFTKSKDDFESAEQAGLEAARKMGMQVDAKTSGGIMCTTAMPPADKATMGFGTTCTVMSKAPTYAVIDVTAKTQKDMVPLEKLRAIADKMAGRM